MPSRVFALVACLLLVCSAAWAQQSFGSITGTVSDPQGARIPGASVTVTNTDTNRSSPVVSNETGYFEASLLDPGNYSVTVEAPGFKRVVRSGLVLSVAGRLHVPLTLELGQVADTIEVTAEAPMLDTTTASGGRVLDNRQITQLPFSDMNPFALATLAAGMQWTGQPEYRRPFDNGGTSSFNTAGGVGSNEYTIDGAPVTGTGRRVGYVPSSETVEEFRLETSTFDASYGNTSGATINVSTKSGTNTFHGSLYDQHWQQRWNATPHFTRLQYEAKQRAGTLKPGEQKQATGRSNNYGATIGGPVVIPKLFNGKDKLFFYFSYNGIKQAKAETTSSINRTVPTMAWRQGDFSDLLAIDPVKYQIYDPRTARLVNGVVVRDPFPGNKGIPILNPMYKFYEKLYPAPNNVPGLVSDEGFNNYYAAAMPKDENFFSYLNRVDYNVSQRHRVFGRWYWNDRLADEYDWTYETMRGLHRNGLTRVNKGGGGDWIWTISNSTIMDAGLSWTRFNEGSRSPVRTTFKPSDVGLPAYLDQRAGALHMLPRLDFNNIEDISDSYPYIGTRGTTAEAKVQLTTVWNAHSFKYGYNERRYQFTGGGPGNTSGRFDFRNNFTKATDVINTASNHGLDWASFMMGLPTSISIDTNDSSFWSTPSRALYLNDDWRLTNKLRMTLGLRYEYQGGTTERFNRGLGNFDPGLALPISQLAQAAYAQNPIAGLPASEFRVVGGNTYLGLPNKGWTAGVHSFLPRVGVVYSIGDKTVIRAGYGRYQDVFNVLNDRPGQDGYSQQTTVPLTTDNGLTFCCGIGAAANLSATRNVLTDPFPVRPDGTRFNEPYGNALDGMIRVGRNFKAMPYEFEPATQDRFRFSMQRQLRSDMVVEVAYNHARSRFFPFGETDDRREVQRVDFLPQQYWTHGMQRNQANDDFLNANVTNPFWIGNFDPLRTSNPVLYNYMNSQSLFTSKTIARHRLLR
ncbi:MAG TPA: TonB-dependent receptor, partial [Bryobacteraceae bacterium]|nr:TonB-dependent receptor [Bryobacteraceae bacterium]